MSEEHARGKAVERRDARQWEARFLSAVSANAERLGRLPPRPGKRALSPARWRPAVLYRDRADAVRRLLADHEIYDRALLEEMPSDGVTVVEFRRRGWFRRGAAVRLVGLVVNPLEDLALRGRADRPARLDQTLRRLEEVLPRDGAFNYVGAFSPTGWEPSAPEGAVRGRNYELYLVEKGAGTEWRVVGRGAAAEAFNPESEAERLARCQAAIRRRRGETMLGGLTAEVVSADTGVDRALAERALRQAARDDPHLHLVRMDGVLRLVLRSAMTAGGRQPDALARNGGTVQAPASPGRSDVMSLWQRLLQWLRLREKKTDPGAVVRELEERRAKLQVLRDELDRRVEDLERTQRELAEELKGEESGTRQRGLARKIANVRRHIGQLHRQMSRYDRAIGVYTTHISNLTAAVELREMKLPSEEEMKQVAVEVDAADEELVELSDLALSLEEGAAGETADPEVEAILEEFGLAGKGTAAASGSAGPVREGAESAGPEATAEPEGEPPAQPEPPPREAAPPSAD